MGLDVLWFELAKLVVYMLLAGALVALGRITLEEAQELLE